MALSKKEAKYTRSTRDLNPFLSKVLISGAQIQLAQSAQCVTTTPL
jgi:hypothetical protein